MPKQTLFDISDDLIALDELIHESEGNLDDPAVAEALKAFEDEIVNNMEVKVDNYAAFIRTLESRAKARDEEAKRLAARAKTDTNSAKSLTDRLKYVLEKHNVMRLDTPRFRIGIVNNGGNVPLIVDCASTDLPEEYREVESVVTPNKTKIREALVAGKEIPGCHLGERGRRLSIK